MNRTATCPVTVHLGVYALGAADAAERRMVEAHLPECVICSAELARLAPLADLLAKVPQGLLPDVEPTRARHRIARPARSWRKAAVAVATAAAGFVGGLWLAPHGAATVPTADVTMSAADPATHVRATAALTGTSWGTSIRLVADGVPSGQLCWLVVRARGGQSEVTGYWDAGNGGPVSVPASAAWQPSDIASVQVVTKAGVLVTVTARSGQSSGPAPSTVPTAFPYG